MSTTNRRQLVHHLLRAGILAGFAIYIVYLVRTGSMTLYIEPRTVLYVKLSAIGLIAAAVYQFSVALQAGMGINIHYDCDCGHEPPESVWKNLLIYGLFLFPLTLGFIFPNGMFDVSTSGEQGYSFTGIESSLTGTGGHSPSSLTEEQLNRLFPADESSESFAEFGKRLYRQKEVIVSDQLYMETLSTLERYRPHFIGKTVVISGFVYRQEGMTSEQLAVGRYAADCCPADAQAYGMVISASRAAAYSNGTWVTVRGTLSEGSFNDQTLLLEAQHIQATNAPDSPDVYPGVQLDRKAY
ncbi:TIGR03943 family putative permease subunit [Paenibacillus spongiae]|uniref:TIGR03943 family protein n=1 Tax=Paenibacillus spongiae TaxID=2909671 RepID=A0ABY5SG95_9BACL|nr:TIGR03943 family protein [Paenibacillus spongiae]UVI31698.1 TIGR03943 family protein [Paenibacillus spongiae]